jgi:hypothetical protein
MRRCGKWKAFRGVKGVLRVGTDRALIFFPGFLLRLAM